MKEPKSKNIAFLGVKAVALPVLDMTRAGNFYGKVLGLPAANHPGEPDSYLIGETILLLKPDWYAAPSAEPSPRITLQVDDARSLVKVLKERGVTIGDEVIPTETGFVASFLDSEGNKLWFCSYD
jgi:predicted enzyme related to lactoylglutathione lyase